MKWILSGSAMEYARVIRSCASKRDGGYSSGCSGCVFNDIGNFECEGIEFEIEYRQIEDCISEDDCNG